MHYTVLLLDPTLPTPIFLLYQDLSFGEIFAGRPEAWLVKKIFLLCMQSQNFKIGPHIEIQNKFQHMFRFYDNFNGL